MVDNYQIIITPRAIEDLRATWDYLVANASVTAAKNVRKKIVRVIDSLETLPGR